MVNFMSKNQYNNKHTLLRVCLLLFIIPLLLIILPSKKGDAEDKATAALKTEIQTNSISNSPDRIQFSPEINKEYSFTIKVSNTGNTPIEVSIFSSLALPSGTTMTYVKTPDKSFNPDYNLTKYVTIKPLNATLENDLLKLEANQSTDIQIIIKVDKDLEGEILGGINFSQITGNQKNKNSVDIIQVHQKVTVVRLKMKELTNKKDQTYSDFNFTSSKETSSLNYVVSNNNPLISYAESGSYKVISPDNKVIAKGNLDKNKVVLSPYGKSQLSLPLLDKAELASGDYQFILTSNGKEKITKFTYSKDKINEFVNKTTSKNNVTVQSQNNTWLIILLAIVSTLLVVIVLILYFKNRKSKK